MMDRRNFLRSCGAACLGGIALATALQSCNTTRMISGTIAGSFLVIDRSAFETVKDGETLYRKYVVVHNEELKFPICVYRFGENDYTALYMQCTHQGAELQAFGDKLQCPAHGSEFSNRGQVESGPATAPLRTFPVSADNNELKISLV
jgi:Rieske Fe-S protein